MGVKKKDRSRSGSEIYKSLTRKRPGATCHLIYKRLEQSQISIFQRRALAMGRKGEVLYS